MPIHNRPFSIHPLRKSNFLSFDFDRLVGLLGFDNYDELKDADFKWVSSDLFSQFLDMLLWPDPGAGAAI
jgi:hypothetical protein